MSTRLTEQQFKEFTSLAEKGMVPADLASKFNIGIATVHNYKNELKGKGVNIPNVRGKRPGGVVNSKAATKGQNQDPHLDQEYSGTVEREDLDALELIVSGVSITISSQAKSVRIDHHKIVIEF